MLPIKCNTVYQYLVIIYIFQLLKVRDSICVVGYNWDTIQYVKQKITSFVDQPLPLESLHIQKNSDLKEGALLVPKVSVK